MIKLQSKNGALEITKNGSKFGDFVMQTFNESLKLDNTLFNILVHEADQRREDGDVFRSSLQSWLYNNIGEQVSAILVVE